MTMTSPSELITGSGGGGGGKFGKGGESPNTLRSSASARFVYLLGQGPLLDIDPADLPKRGKINKTPIQNPDGSYNFENTANQRVQVSFTPGTADQNGLAGFAGRTESEYSVGQVIRKDIGIAVRYAQQREADAIRLRFQLPGLAESSGQSVSGSTVECDITITDATGAILTTTPDGDPGAFRLVIEGKATYQFEISQTFQLSRKPPYRIAIQRITDDSKSDKVRNDLSWASYVMVSLLRLRWPNMAMLGISVNAQLVQSLSEVGIDTYGIQFPLPHNYNPTTRIYSGTFDGRFSNFGWTNNAALVFYGLLTNKRWGAGRNLTDYSITVQTRFLIYAAAKYCDELVDDGKGGLEPRFTFNAYITSRIEAKKLFEDFASSFQAILYQAKGQFSIFQDRPLPSTRIYTPANVIREYDDNGNLTKPPFDYSGVDKNAIHTYIIVKFKDAENFYQDDAEPVFSEDAQRKFGYNPLVVDAFWCTSRAQARRIGQATLETELAQTKTVNFQVSDEGMLAIPGEVVTLVDPLRKSDRRYGRLANATTNTVTLDRTVTLKPGRSYILHCLLGERVKPCDLSLSAAAPFLITGTGFDYTFVGSLVGAARVLGIESSTTLIVNKSPELGIGLAVDVTFRLPNYQMTRTVTTPSGTVKTLTVTPAYPSAPILQSTWVLSDTSIPENDWQILGIAKNDDGNFDMTAVLYDRSKYDRIDSLGRNSGLDRIKQNYPGLPKIDSCVLYTIGTNSFVMAWKPIMVETTVGSGIYRADPNIASYLPQYRVQGGNWVSLPETAALTVDLSLPDGAYEGRVAARDYVGRIGPFVSSTAMASNAIDEMFSLVPVIL
jgi:predicted phage tail protein